MIDYQHYIIISSQNDLKYTLYNSCSPLSVFISMQISQSQSLFIFLSQSQSLFIFLSQSQSLFIFLSQSLSLSLSAYREVKFLLSKNILHFAVLIITQP